MMPNPQREFGTIEPETKDVTIMVNSLLIYDLKSSLYGLHKLTLNLLRLCE